MPTPDPSSHEVNTSQAGIAKPSDSKSPLAHELETRVKYITSLIDSIEQDKNDRPVFSDELASGVAGARLGIAAGLFDSIRMKHAPTALHCLRVALGCSAWYSKLEPKFEPDDLEIAALLHDMGKIGVPDEILTKPTQLNVDERQIVDSQRQKGVEILKTFCKSRGVIDCVQYSSHWFDGSKNPHDKKENEIPMAARMLAIADAFDSMTTDQVYRKALSIDRAVAELYEHAGTQFDPNLVKSFVELVARDWFDLQVSSCQNWSTGADPQNRVSALWSIAQNISGNNQSNPTSPGSWMPFQSTVFSQMLDAVIFVDRQAKILFWNPAAERITGLTNASVLEKRLVPGLLGLQDESGAEPVQDDECPIQRAMKLGETLFSRFSIQGRGHSRNIVDLQISPVLGHSGEALGATVVMHDSSTQGSLEERVESLFSRVAHDPLTRVANRAEFDRVHAEFVEQHLKEKTPCSLVICNLDSFNKVNEELGNKTGDQALIAFASLLKRINRVGDLVARYGGDQFVLLCAGSDNKTATSRAEEIRNSLQNTPLDFLNQSCLTASFGVTEVQQGDSPELMLRRAERALMTAKEGGGNRVVQLGTGMDENFEFESRRTSGFLDWFRRKTMQTSESPVLHRLLISHVPLELAIQKLKGFVTDQDAQIVDVEGHDISIKVSGTNPNFTKRQSDRPIPFSVLLQFTTLDDENQKKRTTKTLIKVTVTPNRSRDRRANDLSERATLIINSLKSYLMASCEEEAKTKSGLEE